jgi:hypothetical protein
LIDILYVSSLSTKDALAGSLYTIELILFRLVPLSKLLSFPTLILKNILFTYKVWVLTMPWLVFGQRQIDSIPSCSFKQAT